MRIAQSLVWLEAGKKGQYLITIGFQISNASFLCEKGIVLVVIYVDYLIITDDSDTY